MPSNTQFEIRIEEHNVHIPSAAKRLLQRSSAVTMLTAVNRAAGAIVGLPRDPVVKPGDGHRSVVTLADPVSQETIIDACLEDIPAMRFYCEESSNRKVVLPRDNPEGMLKGDVGVIDSLDGTALYGSRIFDAWAIGGGILQDGHITGGAVISPEPEGGIAIASHEGCGAVLVTRSGAEQLPKVPTLPPKKSVVLVGVDTTLYRAFTESTLPEIAANVRAVYTTGSGHYGLMMVAMGRAQAVFQTPQKLWDWVPAYRAVVETGNEFRFFLIRNGELILQEGVPEIALTNPMQNRLGFLAGNPRLIDRMLRTIPVTGWGRFDPDTVGGAWA